MVEQEGECLPEKGVILDQQHPCHFLCVVLANVHVNPPESFRSPAEHARCLGQT
jgi:hypothetical protein